MIRDEASDPSVEIGVFEKGDNNKGELQKRKHQDKPERAGNLETDKHDHKSPHNELANKQQDTTKEAAFQACLACY